MSRYIVIGVSVVVLIAVVAVVAIYFVSPELLGIKQECVYTADFGEWGSCDEAGETTRSRPFEGEELSHCEYTQKKKCSEIECEYSDTYGEFSEPDENGVKTALRKLIKGAVNVCTDLTKTEKVNVIELQFGNQPTSTGFEKINVQVIYKGEHEYTELKKNMPVENDKNYFIYPEKEVDLVNLYYSDTFGNKEGTLGGGDLLLKDIKYNGKSYKSRGIGSKAIEGTMFWKDNYSYNIGYEFLGCWKDTKDRAMETYKGTVPGRADQKLIACKKLASDAGSKYFSIQTGDECWLSSKDDGYKKHGEVKDCGVSLGGAWINSVYKV